MAHELTKISNYRALLTKGYILDSLTLISTRECRHVSFSSVNNQQTFQGTNLISTNTKKCVPLFTLKKIKIESEEQAGFHHNYSTVDHLRN